LNIKQHNVLNITDCSENLIEKVIGAAIEVHKILGPGLMESAYELALMHELAIKRINVKRQADVTLEYKGEKLGTGFRADLIIEDCLLLELKAVENLNEIHMAQVITYLKFLKLKRGLLINFNRRLLKHGIKRVSV
jgi:GxxExxY protein